MMDAGIETPTVAESVITGTGRAAGGHESTPCAVELHGIEKRFRTEVAVQSLDLRIEDGEFLSLLGPSGCGKTTLLRMIAGLEVPTSGTVEVFGEDVTDRPPNKRPINLVFQRATLFPHLTVAENVAFGPKLRRANKEELARKVSSLLELVDLAEFGPRRVNELSGGQAQRIALVRALANDPKVLLLDEPLSALDLAIRRQLQGELKDIHRRLGMTFIFVTHDQEEALSMSDRVAVMRSGRIEQLGSPADIYRHPANPFVAKLLGLSNIFPATVSERRDDAVVLDCDGLRILAPPPDFALAAAEQVSVVVRPDAITLTPAETASDATGAGGVAGRIVDARFAGSTVHYGVETARHRWRVSVAAALEPLRPVDTEVLLSWPASGCVVMPAN